MSFCHLHRHSEYSRLDGIGTAKQYASRAAELGQIYLAQTDHGTMSGALHHFSACRENGVLPIMGVEAYYRPDRKPRGQEFRKKFHLTLLAKNLTGWHNLLRLVSHSYKSNEEGEGFEQGGFYDKPVVDDELLDHYREGIICLSGCIVGYLAQLIAAGDDVAAREFVTVMKNRFRDNFWLEVQPYEHDDQRKHNLALASMGNDYSIGLVATNDVHFPYKDWAETQRVAKIMGHSSCMSKVAKKKEEAAERGEDYDDYLTEQSPTLYLAHEEEMFLWFEKNHPDLSTRVVEEAIGNTLEVAKCVKPFLLSRSVKMPKVSDNAEELLGDWIDEGLERIEDEYPDEHWEKWSIESYVERAEYEFDILKKKNALDYMVLLGKVIRWAKSTDPIPGESGKKRPIRIGAGRGSAAGCLISYLIGITTIDPIPHNLLFERFLNPGRKGMPDIDIDVDSERRGELKRYLAALVGKDHVAQIVTYSTFQPRKVIQDICRVFDDRITYPEAMAITNTIEIRQDSEETTLDELLPINRKLQWLKETHPDLWEHALRLEGSVANAGTHAAGVVVTPKPVSEYVALERGKKGDLVTSWSDTADFPAISDNGILKYDFLGLDALTRQEYACKLIEKVHGVEIDLEKLDALRDPYAVDEETMKIFCEGFTVGVFQFGSRGITSLLKDIQPESINDLAAANALYRPGPMKSGDTWEYAKRKSNKFMRTYLDDALVPILEETYGTLAYQEQVMLIGQALGGFSQAEADDLRKAMGKLYRLPGDAAKRFMQQFADKWFETTDKLGIKRSVSERLWGYILDKGGYTFNKSHSSSYSIDAYQDAWIEAHYPDAFFASLLTYEKDEETRKAALRQAGRLGVEIVFPDVNKSGVATTISKDGSLILGLESIKGVGDIAAKEIVKLQPFSDAEDFIRRATGKIPIKDLIEAGALDSIGDRVYLLSKVRKLGTKQEQIWTVWEHLKHNNKLKTPRDVPTEREEPSHAELMRIQASRLSIPIASMSLSDHLTDFLRTNVYTPEEIAALPEGSDVIAGGEITSITRKETKNGKPYANVSITFEGYQWSVRFWSEALAKYDEILEPGSIIMVAGSKSEYKGYVSIIAGKVTGDLEAIAESELEEPAAVA